MAKSSRSFNKSAASSDAVTSAADRAEKGKARSHNAVAAQASGSELDELRIAGSNPKARAIADMLGDEVFTEFESQINATEYTKVAAILMADHLSKYIPKEKWKEMPVVDTNKTDDENFQGNNPDWTKVKDGKKNKRVSFYNSVLSSTHWVKKLVASIDEASDVVNGKEGASAAFRKQFPNDAERKAQLKKLRQRLTVVQNHFRKGVRVVQQRMRLEELFGDHISYFETRDVDGNIIMGPEPIYLQGIVPKGAKPIYDNFSVSSFLSLDIDAAYAARTADTVQASWDALIDTLSKEEPESEDDPDNIQIDNQKKLETGMASMLGFFQDHPEAITKMVSAIKGAKDIREVMDLAQTIGELANELGQVKQHIQKQYENAIFVRNMDEGKGAPDAKTTAERIAANA